MLETNKIVRGSFFEEESVSQGLALPREVLEKIYYRNAVRIYPRLAKILARHGFEVTAGTQAGGENKGG
jgi:hypothetical protein